MEISRHEASEALQAIHTADLRVWQMRGYQRAAPFLIMWGLIWMVANAVYDFDIAAGNLAWNVGTVVGVVLTAVFTVRLASQRRRAGVVPEQDRQTGASLALMGCAAIGYFVAMFVVVSPLTHRQGNAFISLFWAFAYMFAGAWLGLRLFFTGLVAAAAIVIGFLFVHEHYYLWMAAFGGGSLIVGGLWLRKI